jgi:hypothetical protein
MGKFVLVAERFVESGLKQAVETTLQLPRGSGYGGLDLAMLAIAYFVSERKCGLKQFAEECEPFGPELATVMDRRRFPTQASMSRLLSAVPLEQAEAMADQALGPCSAADLLEDHESVVYRDTVGEKWHVFHWDPTVTTLRHRALPEGDELPAPRRRSEDLAAPGYRGRKRGDVQFSRAMLQHSGTGLWLQVRLRPGNSKTAVELDTALKATAQWAQRRQVAPSRCLVCTDGGNGGWTQMELGRRHEACFLTRLGAYALLKEPEVVASLQWAQWQPVTDSGSGPRREATELGLLSKEPLPAVRLVVSRFPSSDDHKHGAGVLIEGWQYELFATDVAVESMPAAGLVTVYFGRSGQENRFADEDRQLNLDRIFSYQPAGQLLMSAIGLWVLNQRLIFGAETVAPLEQVPYKPQPRAALKEQSAVRPGAPPAVPSSQLEQTSPPTPGRGEPVAAIAVSAAAPPETLPGNSDDVSLTASETTGATPGLAAPIVPPQAAARPVSTGSQDVARPTKETWRATLNALDWAARLNPTLGWTWLPDLCVLRCPSGHALRVHCTRIYDNGQCYVRLRGRFEHCSSCALRAQCSRSTAPKFRKEVWMPLMPSSHGPASQDQQEKTALLPTGIAGYAWHPPAHHTTTPGSCELRQPMLIPTELRRTFDRLCRQVHVTVSVAAPPPQPSLPSYLAPIPAARQHRRKTWAKRQDWNALLDETVTEIYIQGPTSIVQVPDNLEQWEAEADVA